MSSSLKTVIALLIVSFLWSTASASTKILLHDFGPYPIAFFRFLLASLIITPFFLPVARKVEFSKSLLLILLFSAGNIFFFYTGIQYTTANTSNIIYSSSPLLVAVLSGLFLKERLTPVKIWGLLIGFFGVILIMVRPLLSHTQMAGSITGNLLICCAVVSWSFYSLFSRKLSQRDLSPLVLTSLSLYANAITFLVLSLIAGQRLTVIPFIKPENLFYIIHLGLLVSVVTFGLYQWLIKHASATIASMNLFLQPLFGFAINALLLQEGITWDFLASTVFVLGGVYLTTVVKTKEENVTR